MLVEFSGKGERCGNVNFTLDSMVRLVRAAGGEVSLQVAPKIQKKRNNFYRKQGMKKAA